MSVATGPGATEFTVMPRLLSELFGQVSYYNAKGDDGSEPYLRCPRICQSIHCCLGRTVDGIIGNQSLLQWK